jgi:hypothetical protein
MREIKQDVFLNEPFFMTNSGDYGSGVTSLTFTNSGDIQLMKPGGGFTYIDSACYVTERGFGWYTLQSSVAAHMDTLGRNVIHIIETSSLSAISEELLLDVVANRSSDVYTEVTSYDQYKADLTALISGVAAGTVVVGLATQVGTAPMTVYRKNNWNGDFYLNATFSSYISSGYPVYLTAYNKERSGTEIFSAIGSTDISSLTATFSLDPSSHTNFEPGEHYRYEVQFRQESATVIANAVVGTLRIEPTLKL